MRRRGFITVLGGAAAWPLMEHAQQAERVRHVAVLLGWPENDRFAQACATAFAQALGRFGWVEGRNIRIDYRFAAGDPTLFKTYAAELVSLAPDAPGAFTSATRLAPAAHRARLCLSRTLLAAPSATTVANRLAGTAVLE